MEISYYIDTNQIKGDNQNITYFNPNRDSSNWITIFSKKFNLPKDEVSKFLDKILKNDNLIDFIVIIENNSLQATVCLTKGDKENEALLMAIYANEGVLPQLISKLKGIAQHHKFDRLLVTFTHLDENSPLIDTYVKAGFKKLS